MFSVRRDINNPFLGPNSLVPWCSLAAYNPSPIEVDRELYVLYRAQSKPALYHGDTVDLSSIGAAHIYHDGRVAEGYNFIAPSEVWDWYGCEDPRVTHFEGKYYIFYTATSDFPFRPEGIRVGLGISDDPKSIREKHLITPFNAKAMALFPHRINGKIYAILTINSDRPPASIVVVAFDEIEQMWSEEFWNDWYAKRRNRDAVKLLRGDSDQVEVGAVPILTDEGWLLIYSHIENYYSDEKLFGIEAVLLDANNPRKIAKRTPSPFMVPEESYERYGRLPNIIFPSGAQLKRGRLTVYYGSTDSTCCRASFPLDELLASMSADNQPVQRVKRYINNPILLPIPQHSWESLHVLNPGAILVDGVTQILYRAFGDDSVSYVGLATSVDGLNINERLDKPIYWPRADFELKKTPDVYSGCEDPRIVEINERFYMTYTAYNGVDVPQVAISSISKSEFLAHDWEKWTMPHIISPSGIDDKDAAVLSQAVNGRYLVFHRISGHICADYVDTLDFTKEHLNRCIQIIGPRPGMWDSQKVGIAGPALPSPQGWILFYHGITAKNAYCLGAVLLSNEDPTVVLGRTAYPLMSPTEIWEKEGWIPNVVFPCGQVERNGLIYLYYGGADQVVAVATIAKDALLSALMS